MKAGQFLADTAIVALVLLGIVFISGIAAGEASIWPAAIFAIVLFALLPKRKTAKSCASVKHVNVQKYSDCKRAA